MRINSDLAAKGQVFTPLGGNALQKWINENSIQTNNGWYWQTRQLSDGNIAMARVTPLPEVLQAQAAVVVGVEGVEAYV